MKNANTLSRVIQGWRGAWLFAAALAAASAAAAAGGKTAVKSINDYFTVRMGDKDLRLQIAVTSNEQQRGLMYRRNLKPDEGMLFVFAEPQQMSFYMRNTPTPLDIGYLDREGALREVYPLHPFDETPVKSRSEELQYALEVNQGWFRENGIKVGARLDLKAVKAALEARGFKPEAFGLKK